MSSEGAAGSAIFPVYGAQARGVRLSFLAGAVIWLSIYLVLRRFGLLALAVGMTVQNTLVTFPMTTHLSRWYASGAIAGMLVIITLALFAFHSALAGQQLFSAKVLDD